MRAVTNTEAFCWGELQSLIKAELRSKLAVGCCLTITFWLWHYKGNKNTWQLYYNNNLGLEMEVRVSSTLQRDWGMLGWSLCHRKINDMTRRNYTHIPLSLHAEENTVLPRLLKYSWLEGNPHIFRVWN